MPSFAESDESSTSSDPIPIRKCAKIEHTVDSTPNGKYQKLFLFLLGLPL
jgi:hypothetical protein